jgi:hypothetical protein
MGGKFSGLGAIKNETQQKGEGLLERYSTCVGGTVEQ